ncbi:homeobox protein NOBOX [Heteronotia binoei]|uniref:homeobox protein NOBOX n=1 Tax=Heteronotia binoei TaxID=13085 RepID=UPI00292D5FEC|nr:homeobox protein NOBOX [Heteronotia binoei]
MELRARHEDAVCKEKPEEEGKGQRESLLCTEQFVQDGTPVKEAGTRTSLLSVFHTVVIEDEFGKILENRRDPDVAKEEDGSGSYYIDQVSRSSASQPSGLGCQDFTTTWRLVPNYFSDGNRDPSIPSTELAHNLHTQLELQDRAQTSSLNITERETKKKRIGSILVTCPPKTSFVAVGDSPLSEQIKDVNQNLRLSHAKRKSSRCAVAVSTGQQSCKLSSLQISRGNQDQTKEKVGPSERPEEPVPPARKKTRTYYSAEQLDELEKMFQEDHYPDSEKRREIAANVGVTPQRVMVWFQNRRAKWRKIEKLTVKVPKKCPPILSVGPQEGAQGVCLLPVPPLPDMVHNQPAARRMDSAPPGFSSMLSGQPESLASTTVTSVTDVVTSCESTPPEAVAQGSFGPVKEEAFPAIPSPPPVQRASLSLNVAFNPNNHIIPLMLDVPSSEYSPPPSQESQSTEVFTYNIQSQSIASPVRCPFPEQLEPTANLETPYYHPSSQSGAFQLSQYPQPQMSQVHHFPVHLTSSILPSVRLTPATPSKSSTTFFSLPANGGLMAYQTAETTQGYLQNHVGGQLLIQQAAGNSGYIPAFQAVPWNEFYLPGAPLTNQPCSQMQLSNPAERCYHAEQVPGVQNLSMPPTSSLLQLPRATAPGSTIVFSAKPMAPADTGSNLSQADHLGPPERDSTTDNLPQEERNMADFSEESKN